MTKKNSDTTATNLDFQFQHQKKWLDIWFQHWKTLSNTNSQARMELENPVCWWQSLVQGNNHFTNFILTKQAKDFTFAEIIKQFGELLSLLNARYNYLKSNVDSYVTFTDIVNHEYKKFQQKSLTEGQFKCLIFIVGLQSPNNGNIQTQLLSKLEQDKNITVKALTIECQH